MSVSPIQLKFVIPVSGHQIVFYLGLNASVTIDWGDATPTTTTSTSQNNYHTYSAAGTYNVTVTGGTTTSVYKFGIGSNLKMSPYLTEINSWGGFALTHLDTMLFGFGGTLTTIPDLPPTVLYLDYAFADASGTIPDITGWVTTNVTSMVGTFSGISRFNQNISEWDVSNLTGAYATFAENVYFNQPIGSWNVAKLTSAAYMFRNTYFNQPLTNWNVATNCNFTGMFQVSKAFNQSINHFDLSGANMNYMFQNAIAFNQNMGSANITKVTSLQYFLSGSAMSEANINSTLQGWAAQTVRSNVVFDASGYYSGDGYTAATQLRSSKNWTINGLTIAPIQITFTFPISSTFPILGVTCSSTITINFGNGTSTTYLAGGHNISGTYAAGTFTLQISAATTNAISLVSCFNPGVTIASPYLTAINSWGGFNITSLASLLKGYTGTLTAIPPLPSSVTTLSLMCVDLSGTIPDITGWNTSNVTTMTQMFEGAKIFNQAIGSWNVSKVTNALFMFKSSRQFNQPLSNWRFAANCNLQQMFANTLAFNQSIVGWNVTGTNVTGMFNGAASFNQNLGALDISGVTSLTEFMNGSGMSEANVNSTLQGWAAQTVQSNVVLDASGLYYSGAGYTAATYLRASPRSWTINGLTIKPMSLTFAIPTANQQIVFYLGLNASVTINWGDTTSTTTSTSQNNFHTYSASGSYNVTVTGSVPTAIHRFSVSSNLSMSPYLTAINSWGGFSLTSLEGMLPGYTGTLTTIPALPPTVTILDYAFYNLTGTIPDITGWDTSNVTNMTGTFQGSNFNQNISSWNTGNVTTMYRTFGDTTQFNQPIGTWNVSKVTSASYMFIYAQKFNQPVSNLRFAANCNFTQIFGFAPLFNQSIVGWDICGNNVNNMFQNAIAFNQNLGALNISKVSSLSGFFNGAGMSEANINSTLQGWSQQTVRSNVTLDASGLFYSGDGYTAATILRASPKSWTITGITIRPVQYSFVIPASNKLTYVSIMQNSGNTATINWGDGQTTTGNLGDADGSTYSHTYGSAGTYTVTIAGATTDSIIGLGSRSVSYQAPYNLKRVISWGGFNIATIRGLFSNSVALTSVALIPSTVRSLENLFYGYVDSSASVLDISGWDVSGVTNMSGLFQNSNYNPQISDWNTQSVTTLENAFYNATGFNRNLGTWNISNVTNMSGLFSYSGISAANFGSTLLGWSSQTVQPNVVMDAYGRSLDSNGLTGYNALTASPKNWKIYTVYPLRFTITTPTSNCSTAIYLGLNNAVTVIWGDGSSNLVSSTGSVSHVYSASGSYSAYIIGTSESSIYQFGDSTLATSTSYLTQVDSWGGYYITSLAGAFNGINGSILTSIAAIPATVTNLSSLFSGASNVSVNLSAWDVSGVTNMSGLLNDTSGCNPTISSWNTKSVTTLQNAFLNATGFNQSLASWNVTNVTNLVGVFSYSGISTENLGSTLFGWSSQTVQSNVRMEAYGKLLDASGQSGYSVLKSSPKYWSIYIRIPMQLTIATPVANCSTTIYLGISGFVDINWGDGFTTTVSTTGPISHQFASAGTYSVFITGINATSIYQFGDSTLATRVSYLTQVNSWGEFNITSLSGAFNGMTETLTSIAAIPASVTNLSSLFSGASNISLNLSAWDVSGVTNMSSLLKNTTACNPMISAWNTSSVTTLENAFLNATGFNQNLSSWNIANVANMVGAFSYCGLTGTNFSAALYAWSSQSVQPNVVMDASGMYYNQRGIEGYNVLTAPLKSWVINGVTLEPIQLTFTIPRTYCSTAMYLGLNESVTVNWGDGSSNVVSSTGSATHLYSSAGTYRVLVTGSSVNSVYQFGDASLNFTSIYLTSVESYGAFNLTSLAGAFSSITNLSSVPPLPPTVTDVRNMFSYASYVTADISAWDVSGVTNMSEMFSCANGQSGCFNPDITSWNPQNVTNMQNMFYGNNAFNRAIGSWTVSSVTNMSGMFQGASAFNQPLSTWVVSSVTNMSNMFKRAAAFNQDISNWNVSSVANMSNMFNDAVAFNQTVGAWNVSSVTNATNMLNYAGLSSANFSDLLQYWSAQTLQTGVTLGAAGLTYDASGTLAVQTLLTKGWTVSVSAPSSAMTLVFVITSSTTVTFNLAINAGSAATIFWGDRLNRKYTITSSGTTSFVYSRAGTYTATITGTLAGFGIVPGGAFNALSGADKLTTISSFGNIGLTYCNFVGATNLVSVPDVIPSTLTNMYAMFYDCTKLNDANISNWNTANVTNLDYTLRYNTAFNQPLNDWNTANVTSARYTFLNAILFNQPLNNWQMSKATTMEGMLNLARVFNQPIENWNTSNVVNMSSLFSEANSFNQSLNNWDVANVTNMVGTFYGANSFNQPLNNWNTSKVTNMAYMFQHASSFNQPIYTWNTANVTNMSFMFQYANAFNQPIDAWNTANVTNMSYMFNVATSFNQSLNSWNVAKVTSMDWMFESAVAFQGDISAWDVSSVENMNYMFRNMNYNQDITRWNIRSLKYAAAMFQSNTTFNQNISGWNTSTLQDFSYMFYNSYAFNQNIGAWNLKKASSMGIMLTFSGLSVENFSNTLIGWAAQPDASNVTVNAHGLVYNLAGYNAKTTLSMRNFFVTNASLQPMTLTLSIPSAGTSAALYLGMSGTVTVDWGDSTTGTGTGSGTASAIQRTYTSAGTYTVTISSSAPNSIYQFGDPNRVYKSTYLATIITYGPFNFTSFAGAFNNTNYRLTSIPSLPSTVTDINNIFADASSSLTLDISAWDVSGVTNMRGAFQCTAGQTAGYNPNIANWNTKNVTSMELMFSANKSFNRAIGSWNVAKVTNMSDMFAGASAFNHPINSWNTAAVTLMTRMFSGATSFNQPLNNWSIAGFSSAAAMGNMLDNCAMTTANFNDFLVNLNTYSKTGITLGAVGRVFNGTAAIQSFANLRASKSWTINGATSLSSLSQYSGYQFTFVYYNYSGLPAANKVYTLRDGSNAIATFNAGPTVPNTTAYSFTTTLFSGGNHTLSIVDPSGVAVLSSAIVNVSFICFKEDTKILCLKYDREEYVPIQKLKRGDMVKTRLSGYVPIDMIGKTRIYNEGVQERIKDQLYVCKKSKYPEVFEDLYITGAHSILVDNLTDAQKRKSRELFDQVCMTEGKYRLMACIDERAAPYEKAGEYNIYHIALANDDPYSNYGVYANGLLVESCSKRFLLDLSNMVILK